MTYVSSVLRTLTCDCWVLQVLAGVLWTLGRGRLDVSSWFNVTSALYWTSTCDWHLPQHIWRTENNSIWENLSFKRFHWVSGPRCVCKWFKDSIWKWNCKMKRGNVNVIYRFMPTTISLSWIAASSPSHFLFPGSFCLFFSFFFQLILMDSAQSVNAWMHGGCGEDVSVVSGGGLREGWGGGWTGGQSEEGGKEEVNNAWRCSVDTQTFKPSAEGNCSSARRDVSPPFV